MWTRKQSIQLHLARLARKKETKTNKRQCSFNTVQVVIHEGSPEWIRVTMEERICERYELYVWSERLREWQLVRTNVMTVVRWYAQDEVNQEESEHNEVDRMKKGADSTGEVMHI